MAQRILEPGEIESLDQRSIPRIRIPDRRRLFAARAARLQHLTSSSAMAGYLAFLACLVDAQQAALALSDATLPSRVLRDRASASHMPPIVPRDWIDAAAWQSSLQHICTRLLRDSVLPPAVRQLASSLMDADSEWVNAQAQTLLAADSSPDVAVAPFIMAALQVYSVDLASQFSAPAVMPLDVPGVCPLCGTVPVGSIVYANPPFQGYRYLHCGLCATEWHRVRAQCTYCGISGKDVALHNLEALESRPATEQAQPAIRAETCDSCLGYRKIFYQEWDTGVEPVADDVASIELDVLLGEKGYHRIGGNPLLWQATLR
jgi:FdhE protein